jgi:hypothetical protein
MKRLAGMQPYFFPYIGYWQLINAVDCFVLFDDAQYMKGGWVNRNRILKPGGGWQYISVPLKKHAMTEIIKQLAQYKKKAPYFDETNQIVKDILFSNNEQSIGAINCIAIKKLCTYLDIKKEIIVSSEQNFDYSNINSADDWALRHSEQLRATELINPAAGAALFSREKFSSSNIKLSFLKSREIIYSQRGVFEPSLSIIDVLMFNGKEGLKGFLGNYIIEEKNE